MTKYLVLIEPTHDGFSAYVPDVPGCVATGATADQAARQLEGALRMHLAGLRADGQPLPRPRTSADYVSAD